MRKTLVVAAAVTFMAAAAGAVVTENGTSPSNNVEDGMMGITSSGSSASATTAVGPNGTEYTATVKMRGRNASLQPGRIDNVSSGNGSVSFTGYYEAPTPCHTLDHEISRNGSDYILNVVSNSSAGSCVQQITTVRYSGSLEAGEAFSLEIRHDGETVDTVETADPGTGSEPDVHRDEAGLVATLTDWIQGLF